MPVDARALLYFEGEINEPALLNRFHTTLKTHIVKQWYRFFKPDGFEAQIIPDETSYMMHMKIHPVEIHIMEDAMKHKLPEIYLERDYSKVTHETYLRYYMGGTRLRWVESSLYFYLKLLRGGGLFFRMKFPFVNRKDWVHFIAETVQMDYKCININTVKPDENIELCNISTEFYPFKSLPPDREDIMLQLEPCDTKSFDNINIIVTIKSLYRFYNYYLNQITPKKVEQFWKGYMEFSNQNLIHVISLQGKYKEVSIQNMENKLAARLNVYWLETTNQKFHSYRDARFSQFMEKSLLHKIHNSRYTNGWTPKFRFCFHLSEV